MKEKLASLTGHKDLGKGSGGKGSGGGKGSKVQIPEREWKIRMSFPKRAPEVCRCSNSSLNCKFGTGCRQAHKCAQRGGEHSWFGQHGKERWGCGSSLACRSCAEPNFVTCSRPCSTGHNFAFASSTAG